MISELALRLTDGPRVEAGEWLIELAQPADDPAIRRLLARNPVPGPITLGFEREPSYFLGCGPMGRTHQVAVVRHLPSSAVAAVACRATRPVFVNGNVQEVGYLSQLRVDAQFRGRWLAARVLAALPLLHADARVAGYLATITDDNAEAHGLLVAKARRRFPTFRAVDKLYTLALIVWRPRLALSPHPPTPSPTRGEGEQAHHGGSSFPSPRRGRGARGEGEQTGEIERGSTSTVGEIAAFLRRQGAAKQFFPVYNAEDFAGSALTRGFQPEDFVVLRRCGEIAGVMGLWDQSAYKQTVVQGYAGTLRWLRPVYNLAAQVAGAGTTPLPPPGARLSFAYASFICVAENDTAIFRRLLRRVYGLAVERGYAYLMVGLASRDPLLRIAQQYPHVTYRSTLYTVCLPSDEAFHGIPDGRIPYVEIAAL